MAAVRLGGIIALLLSTLAFGTSPKVQALVKEGNKLYQENKYLEAAETLKKAHALEASPVLLYNIARAYDQAGEAQNALDYYRQYVSSDSTDPQLVKKANLSMDRIRNAIAKDEAEKKVREAEKQRLADEAKTAKEKAAAEADAAKKQREQYEAKDAAARAASQKKTDTRLYATIAAGAFAVAALGVGIGFGVAANGSKSSFLTAMSVNDKRAYETATRSQAVIADVSFALSLAAAIAAVVLVPKGSDDPPKSVSVALSPVNGGGLLGIAGRF